jgi:asparagine N-glycosylation enzyme membrane subunit Stt3
LFALFALTVAIRAVTWPLTFVEGRVDVISSDAYYHLRRIWYAVVNNSEILSFDPYVNFPHGGEIYWTPGFDQLIAALTRIFVGTADQVGMETLAVWMPPLIAGLTVVAVVAFTAQVTNWGTGWIAGLMLAVSGGSFNFSQLGLVDHHVLVALNGMLMLGIAMRLLASRPLRFRWAWMMALGLCMAWALWVWTGALIQVGLVQVGLIGWVLLASESREASARAMSVAGVNALAGAILLPSFASQSWTLFGSFTPLAPTSFQPTWFIAHAACLLACGLLWKTRAGQSASSRWITATAIGVSGLAVMALLMPGLLDTLRGSSRWFTGTEAFHERINELAPFFTRGGQVNLWISMIKLSALLFVFPLAWLWIARRAVLLGRDAGHLWMLLLWSAVFCVATLNQTRFLNTFAVCFPVVMAIAVRDAFVTWAKPETSARNVQLVAGATALIMLLAHAPAFRFYENQVRYSVTKSPATDGVVATLQSRARRFRAFDLAARWLKVTAPPTRGYLDAKLQPEYGILCRWDMGHLVHYRSERPVVQDNFAIYVGPENVALADGYFASEREEEALAILEKVGARYVFVDAASSGTGGKAPGSMTVQLTPQRSARGLELGALSHHRLVFDAVPKTRWGLFVYEIVPGARVEGRATPGSVVTAQLKLITRPGRRRFFHTVQGLADAAGQYTLVLPYATTPTPLSQAHPVAPYSIESGGKRASLSVDEADVREARTLLGPALD